MNSLKLLQNRLFGTRPRTYFTLLLLCFLIVLAKCVRP